MSLHLLEPARWIARTISFNRRVRWVALLLPRTLWYRAALLASRLHGRLAAMAGGNGPFTEAIMLDHWLRELTVSGHFPIPWVLVESSGLDTGEPDRGVLFCWTHTPLVEISLHAFVELGFVPPSIVADRGNMSPTMEFYPPGTTNSLPAIPADARGLLRIRTILRRGGSVVCLADDSIAGPLSPLAMKLAGRTGARVVFPGAKRRPDGVVEVSFVPAPYPDCASPAEIAANLHYLHTERERIFTTLGLGARTSQKLSGLAIAQHEEL